MSKSPNMNVWAHVDEFHFKYVNIITYVKHICCTFMYAYTVLCALLIPHDKDFF